MGMYILPILMDQIEIFVINFNIVLHILRVQLNEY